MISLGRGNLMKAPRLQLGRTEIHQTVPHTMDDFFLGILHWIVK